MRQLVILLLLFMVSCVEIKEVAVFDKPAKQQEPDGFNGFYSTNVFDDYITQELWFSPEASCLKVETSKDIKHSGEASLHLKWDKISQSCEWLGLGIGWDAWNGKDLKNIKNTAAIEMMVRNAEGTRVGLHLAACLEDYTDGQAWIGFSANAILAEEIGEEWVKVRLPLSEFEWEAVNGANPSNIKQFIIQFEADGDIYVDDIKIVEFNGSYRKRATVNLVEKSAISIDGEIEKAWGKPAVELNNQKVYMHTDNEFLYVATAFVDQSPLQNSNDNGSIWNGDALEIAFSSAAIQGKPSPYLKSINHHFGIRLNGEPIIWDWQKQKEIDCESKITSNGNNVFYETKIPLAHFGDFNFAHGQVYGFEVAIDQGNKKGRETQMRWNSSSNDGFHQNPTLWGEMIINQVIN